MAEILSPDEKKYLLRVARQSISNALSDNINENLEPLVTDNILVKRASFVTLMKSGILRGCVGGLEARLPLVEDVKEHAVAAAFYDYRFPPVSIHELEMINIEISVLSVPKIINYTDTDSLLSQINPFVDGLVIESNNGRATFLPQVWEKIPEKDLFLNELCKKLGQERDYWRNYNPKIYSYQVEEFHE